ncbi:GNAT family N-acetyltransferase [Clostridiaceae bacterium M8S5]|nr:GNAT family N-acetyltransferase [Clostridiaceae bacterium M8S5]
MYKLECKEYEMVTGLFENLDYYLDVNSVIKNRRGQIFVDNINKPETACIYNKTHLYFAGKENNDEFNDSMIEYILEKLFPAMKEAEEIDFLIGYDENSAWEKVLSDKLRDKHYLGVERRRHYMFNEFNNVDLSLPEGYEIRKIDKELIDNKKLENIDEIIEWTHTEAWTGIDDFLKNGFGFCIIKDDDIVSWSLADFIVDDKAEIGIETDESYQKKGFATKVVTECIKHCLSEEIKDIGWHCWDDNIGSQKTAEKVGFKLTRKYSVLFGWLNSLDNYLVHAYSCYQNKDYKEAAYLYNKAIEVIRIDENETKSSRIRREDNKYLFYYFSARADARNGHLDSALNKLQMAIENGLTDKKRITDESAFSTIEDEKLKALIEQI